MKFLTLCGLAIISSESISALKSIVCIVCIAFVVPYSYFTILPNFNLLLKINFCFFSGGLFRIRIYLNSVINFELSYL